MGFIVAVDGTAGSGKGTITKIIAEKLNFFTVSTVSILSISDGIKIYAPDLENFKTELKKSPTRLK